MEHLLQDAYCRQGQCRTGVLNSESCLDWGFSCVKIHLPILNDEKEMEMLCVCWYDTCKKLVGWLCFSC